MVKRIQLYFTNSEKINKHYWDFARIRHCLHRRANRSYCWPVKETRMMAEIQPPFQTQCIDHWRARCWQIRIGWWVLHWRSYKNKCRNFYNQPKYSNSITEHWWQALRIKGKWKKRLKSILSEIKAQDKAILFIDEIHTLMDKHDACLLSAFANYLLKPKLAKRRFTVIGATTAEEYHKRIEKGSRHILPALLGIDAGWTWWRYKLSNDAGCYWAIWKNIIVLLPILIHWREAQCDWPNVILRIKNYPSLPIDLCRSLDGCIETCYRYW